ncbi:siderophore-interacting protein [Actinoplanes sp. NPDC024001]|uniref:siderophore-interacting protein n=1 Tax=Actinoplanes sp. NPDC024001 TaxID=3154598 RepID=UPI0033FE2A18
MSSRSMRSTVTFPIVLRELTVLRVADVNAGTRRITVGGPQFGAFHRDGLDLPALRSEGFDDHVKLFFAAPGADRPVLPRQQVASLDWSVEARPIAKDYTPHRVTATEMDLDFVRHGSGPAATWAESARPGDPVWVAGPKMSLSHPAGADVVIAAGDETALPAIRRWLREMPAGTRAYVFIEISAEDRKQDLPTAADAEISWLISGRESLAEAVSTMPWPDGTVFVWVAGEAGAIKPLRRYLRVERGLPPEQMEITGYWKLTAPVAAADEDEDEAHERLHELTDLTPGLAIRAAVTLGLIELVNLGADTAELLARETDADLGTLRLLLGYLAGLDVLTVDADGRYGLGELGDELLEDADWYHLDGAEAALDLSLLGLVETVRRGRPAAGLRATFESDSGLGGAARATIEESAMWMVPTLIDRYDWSGVRAVAATGHGAGVTLNALAKAHPQIELSIAAAPSALGVLRDQILDAEVAERTELVPTSGAVPVRPGAVHLLVRALEWLTDEDAEHLLTEFAAGLPGGAEVVLVEECRSLDDTDPEEIEWDLKMRCAFGSGRRTEERVGALLAAAGLRVVDTVDIGWSHRLWRLARG